MQGIYKIIYNDKIVYIGSSINIHKRWKQHISALKHNKHKNFLLQRIYNKGGNDSLNFYIIEECNKENLIKREQYYIDTYKPYCNLADANGRHLHTEETKQKMRGRIVSLETRIKLSKSHKGIPSKLKGVKTGRVPKSAFKKGNIPWNTGKAGTGICKAWNKNKRLSEEHKRKLSIAHKNKPPTSAQLKYWESLKGRKLSKELKEKIKKSTKIAKNRRHIYE